MDLSMWGSPPVAGRLGGGHRNEVYRVGDDWVARRSRRPLASLEWELDLLDHLSGCGFVVPEVVPARDGRRHVDGVVVQRWLPGREPSGDDWPLVVAELHRLHELMTGWPPRPDFPGTRELLTIDQGGDVDLTAMPVDAVRACRAAWRALPPEQTVIHGDPCAANIRLSGDRVGFLDWDEARVDHPWLDLADIPGIDLPPAATTATDAWEAANAWLLEPDYARGRLAQL
ncbi:phosphotransferase enzyme family protein [Actinophytocola sp.]|uniref:phosphotransferase enzyme family protein n=1 Tax=Actinophytocola sp. TaxID=1872138 RepID=UPI002ED01FB2